MGYNRIGWTLLLVCVVTVVMVCLSPSFNVSSSNGIHGGAPHLSQEAIYQRQFQSIATMLNLPDSPAGVVFCSHGWYREKSASMMSEEKDGTVCPDAGIRWRASEDYFDAITAETLSVSIPTTFFLNYKDFDFSVAHCRSSEENIRAVEEKTDPRLFWLSWNPTVNETTGTLRGHRTLIIPDFDTFFGMRVPRRRRSYEMRSGLIAWRGSTTGCIADFTATDRYRTVDAFKRFTPKPLLSSGAVDVAFSSTVQGVQLRERTYIRKALPHKDMMKFKAAVDIDGNANAWSSLQWKLASGMCVLKVRSSLGFVQWYYHLLQHGVHVWLLDPTDPEAMVKEAIRVASNATLCSMLGRNAIAFAREHFTESANRAWLKRAVQSVAHPLGVSSLVQDWRIRE